MGYIIMAYILAFILGGLVGVFFMALFIAKKEDENDNKRDG